MGRVVAILAVAALLGACSRDRPPREFVVAAPYDVTTMDPHRDNTVSNFAVLSNVYEPLTGTDRETRVKPALAERWETPDPNTWLLRIRRGVRFHSGRPLTAADVVYSLRRLMTQPELDMQSFVIDVLDVDAPDAHTVRVRTRRPTRVLLNKLHFALIVPAGSTQATLDTHPDGTGPYAVASWSATEVRLRRHDGYWSTPARIERARFVLGPARRDVFADLLRGEVNLAQGVDGVQDRLGELPRHSARWHENIYVKLLGFDVARERTPYASPARNPYRDQRVRQAVHLAIDRQALVAALPNRASPASQPVRHFIFGFDPGLPVARADPARARALLAQAGFPSGFDGTLHARSILAAAAVPLVAQLAAVGIRLELQLLPDSEYFERIRRRDASVWLTRYGCPTGDTSDILENVIHSRDPERRLGNQNDGGFSDPDLDRLIEESVTYDVVPDRQAAMQRALRATMTALPVVPLYTDQDLYVLDDRYDWQPRNDSYIRLAEVSPKR